MSNLSPAQRYGERRKIAHKLYWKRKKLVDPMYEAIGAWCRDHTSMNFEDDYEAVKWFLIGGPLVNDKIEPNLADYATALENDPAIDPPLDLDPNACVCFDDNGNPLNQCNECPR